ncbi:MAG: hypothetical protein N2258_08070 [Brevinematales bacterium]|nr:hypothetical protein [Brevinematales bacterium]
MEILLQKVDKALAKTGIPLGNYVLNPYKGCLVGCDYCYVQYNKGIQKTKKEWGEFVFVKEKFVELLEKELMSIKDIDRVLIGSTTEVFQILEDKFNLIISSIRLLKKYNVPFVLLTKQPFVADYIQDIDYSNRNLIYITVNSEIIRKLFEKRSFPMEERIEAINKLFKNKLNVIAYIGPFFPELTDINEIFEILQGKVSKVYIEAYHPKMGNFSLIKRKLEDRQDILDILMDKHRYVSYWEKKKMEIEEINKLYNYELKFFITQYDSYY